MRLLIGYDNPQHRFITNMTVTVSADGIPQTQTSESKKGALFFDIPDGAQALTLMATIPNPETGEPPLLNVNQSSAKVILANGTGVWKLTPPIDRRIKSTLWFGASKTSNGIFHISLDLQFFDLTDYASKLDKLSDPSKTPFTIAPVYGSTFAVLECTDPFPAKSTGAGAVTWPCLIPPKVTSPGSPPAAVGALLFLRPASPDPYTNTDYVASNTDRLRRFASDPPPGHPFYVTGTPPPSSPSFLWTPSCGWEAQLVKSGKPTVLFLPIPHVTEYGSIETSRMPDLVRSALKTLWLGGRLGNVGSVPGSRLALGGLSIGGSKALKALRQSGNAEQVDELYLFEPADFGLRVKQIEDWFKLKNKVLRMIAGIKSQSDMTNLASKLADKDNATCVPDQADYWYTSPLYQAAVSRLGSLEHFDPVGTVPTSGDTPSGASGIFLKSYNPSTPELILSWTPPVPGAQPIPFTFSGSHAPSHEEAASLVFWQLIPLYSTGSPVPDQQTFIKIMKAITVVPKGGEPNWTPGARSPGDRIFDIRHQWTVAGGQGAKDRQTGFKGFLQICLENSQF